MGAEVLRRGGYVGVWWERCVEDVCGVGRWVVVVVVGIEAFVEMGTFGFGFLLVNTFLV